MEVKRDIFSYEKKTQKVCIYDFNVTYFQTTDYEYVKLFSSHKNPEKSERFYVFHPTLYCNIVPLAGNLQYKCFFP